MGVPHAIAAFPVSLHFEDPARAGTALTDLFVAGAVLKGNLKLMAKALHARRLTLSRVLCPGHGHGFYVYIKDRRAGSNGSRRCSTGT